MARLLLITKGLEVCHAHNTKKKIHQDMDMLVDVDFQKNAIYVCPLVASLGNNLHTIAIVKYLMQISTNQSNWINKL